MPDILLFVCQQKLKRYLSKFNFTEIVKDSKQSEEKNKSVLYLSLYLQFYTNLFGLQTFTQNWESRYFKFWV